jgi:hypothetical protein
VTAIVLKRFTQYSWGHDNTHLEAWVNPQQIAYVAPRVATHGREESPEGTLIYFNLDNGVLAVREDIDEVLAILAGRDYDREHKIDLTYEAARQDLLP